MPYADEVQGVVGLNYRAEPLAPRVASNAATAAGMQSDPATPILAALAGDPIRIHVLAPHGEQAHVFVLDGHRWPQEPGLAGTNLLSAATIGPMEAITIAPSGGAGGEEQLPGDYLYGDQRAAYREAGLWGLLRVYPAGDARPQLRVLPSP